MKIESDSHSVSRFWLFATPWTIHTVHGTLQARVPEWTVSPFSRGASQSRDGTQVSRTAGRFFTIWATRETRTSGCYLLPGTLPSLTIATKCTEEKISLWQSFSRIWIHYLRKFAATWKYAFRSWRTLELGILPLGFFDGSNNRGSACRAGDPSLTLGWEDPLEKRMATRPVLSPGEFHGQRSLAGSSPWGWEEWLSLTHTHSLSLSPYL